MAQDLDDMAFAFGKTHFLKKVPGVLNLDVLHAMAADDPEAPRSVGLRKLANMSVSLALKGGAGAGGSSRAHDLFEIWF